MIATLANQYYERHFMDFLVLDISPDGQTLSTLARAGDPFRYLAVGAVDTDDLIDFAFSAATHKRLIIIDDIAQHVRASIYDERDVRFVSKSSLPHVLSDH